MEAGQVAGGRTIGGVGGVVLALGGGTLLYRRLTGHWPLSRPRGPHAPSTPAVERSLTIGASADDLYRAWRARGTLPRVMEHVAAVTATDDGHAHWTARGPLGRRLEWDTRVVEDRPGEVVRWESTAGAAVPSAGTVRFHPAPGDRGTEVALRVRFDPPGGALGDAALRQLSVVPGLLADKALRRFKSLVETGEIPTLARQPAARDGGRDT